MQIGKTAKIRELKSPKTTTEFGFHKSGYRRINSLLLFLLGGKLHNQFDVYQK